MERKPMLEKEYRIPFSLFQDAFTAFQKRYVFPRTRIVMALLLIAAAIYSYFVVAGTDSQRPIYCMVVMVCLVCCAMQWYNPRKIRRNLMEGIREIEEDRYRLRVFADCLEIGTLLPPEELPSEEERAADALFDDEPQEDFTGTRIFYTKDIPITEYRDFFLIYLKKQMFYVVPKGDLTDGEIHMLRQLFSEKLGKGFAIKSGNDRKPLRGE